jgi:hypothetical protein
MDKLVKFHGKPDKQCSEAANACMARVYRDYTGYRDMALTSFLPLSRHPQLLDVGTFPCRLGEMG